MPSQAFQDLRAALPPDIPVFEGKAGDDLTIAVDVNDMQFPYSVNFQGSTLIFGFVDRAETVENLQPGKYTLSWTFHHGSKNWKHEVTATLGQKPATVLDSRCEAKKDRPFRVGVAFFVIE